MIRRMIRLLATCRAKAVSARFAVPSNLFEEGPDPFVGPPSRDFRCVQFGTLFRAPCRLLGGDVAGPRARRDFVRGGEHS